MIKSLCDKPNNTKANKPKDVPRQMQNASYSLFEIAEAAEAVSKNPRSKIAVAEFFEKLKVLERQWYQFGNRYDQIQRDNEELLKLCEKEKQKTMFYRKRLKFAKEHQDNFDRLQKLYVDIKEIAPVDVEHKGVQTSIDIDTDQLNSAKNTLVQIKELVHKRESFYENNIKNMDYLQAKIDVLEMQNQQLTKMMVEKSMEQGEVIGPIYYKPPETNDSGAIIETCGEGEGILGSDLDSSDYSDNIVGMEGNESTDESEYLSIPANENPFSELQGPSQCLREMRNNVEKTVKRRRSRSSYDMAEGRERQKIKNQYRRNDRDFLTRVQSDIQMKHVFTTEKVDSFSQIRQ